MYGCTMLDRSGYLDCIRTAGTETRAKMVAGIRHSGKSFLFYQFICELREAGIDDDHIIRFNFESKVLDLPRTAHEVEAVINKKSRRNRRSSWR